MHNRTQRGVFLLLTVALTLLVLVGSAAADARNGGGRRRPYGPIPQPTVNGGWLGIGFGEAVGSSVGPFTFTSSGPTVLKFTDAYCSGDRFRISDNGVVLGETSASPTASCDFPGFTDDPNAANTNPMYSHGVFSLPPGAHSIVIQVLAAPFGDGTAFVRIDSVAAPQGLRAKPARWQNGTWILGASLAYPTTVSWFAYGAVLSHIPTYPLMCDWDGDGTKTPGVFVGGLWTMRNSNSAGANDIVIGYGLATDLPICGDWDGNGTETVGVIRGNQWFLRNSNTTGGGDFMFQYGQPGDRFVVGDWNGDNVDTPGVYREGTWFLRNSNSSGNADIVFVYNPAGGLPVAGDWDGDGRDSVGLVRGDTWFLRNSLTPGWADLIFPFGGVQGQPLVSR